MSRRPLVRMFLICAAAGFLVRLAVVVVQHVVAPYALAGDAVLYDALARSLLAGHGFARDGVATAIVGPAYPVFVALVYSFTGGSVFAVAIAQALLGGVATGLVALIGSRVARPAVGYAAAGLFAVYPHLLVWTAEVLTETLFVTLSVLALWLLIEVLRRGSMRWAFGAALVLASAALTRTEMALFIPIAAAIVWRMTPKPNGLRTGLVLLAVAVVLLGGWATRNAIEVGVANLGTGGASVLWLGHNPNAIANHRDGYVYGADLPTPVEGPLTEARSYGIYMRAVAAYVSSDPLSVIRSVPAKAWNMFRPTFGGARLATFVTLGLSWLALVALAAVGAWRGGLGRSSVVVWAYVGFLTALHLATIAEIRYRMPIEAALTVPAGAGSLVVAGYLRARFRERSPAPSRTLRS